MSKPGWAEPIDPPREPTAADRWRALPEEQRQRTIDELVSSRIYFELNHKTARAGSCMLAIEVLQEAGS